MSMTAAQAKELNEAQG